MAKQMTIVVPMSGCFMRSAQAAATTSRSGFVIVPNRAYRVRPRRQQQLGGVEHERDLEELGGLELEDAGAEPARGAVHGHAHAREHHGGRQDE